MLATERSRTRGVGNDDVRLRACGARQWFVKELGADASEAVTSDALQSVEPGGRLKQATAVVTRAELEWQL